MWAVPVESGLLTVDERGRSYRGLLEATGGGALRLVNQLGVEDYLRGMQEVPSAWPAAAIQAQTIAARTYALRAMRSGGELCDDARCQVYVGRTAETGAQDAAVYRTAGRVLTYGNALAAAVYSADAGGVSATTLEGFGTPDGVYPYLTTVRYETDNPLPWHIEVALTDVADRMSYPGELTSVRVGTTGPSGRAMDLVLVGTAGEVTVDARQFKLSLGLRSTRFQASIGSSDGVPPPPPPGEATVQALPDDAAAIAQRPVRRAAPNVDRRARAVDRVALGTGADLGRRALALAAITVAAALAGALTPIALAQPAPAALRGAAARVRRLRRPAPD
ncbi:MAG: SpoIID/LytB domain-containing protein [Microthrixaceae bacterium]